MAKRRARPPSHLRTCNYSLRSFYLCLQRVMSTPMDFYHSHHWECPTIQLPHPGASSAATKCPLPATPTMLAGPGLRVFHPSETLPLGLGPALPRTPPSGCPSPIARMTSSELSRGPRPPESTPARSRLGSPPSTTWSQIPSAFPDRSGSDLYFSSLPLV